MHRFIRNLGMLGLFALTFITSVHAQTASKGLPYFPQQLPTGTIVGRLSAGPGPTEAIPFATVAEQLLDNGFTIVETGTGASPTGADFNFNSITITDSLAADNNPNYNVNGLKVQENVGGSTVTGSRIGIFGDINMTATTSPSNALKTYTGVTGLATASANDGGTSTSIANAKGALFGMAIGSVLSSGATNWLGINGEEVGIAAAAGSSTALKFGVNVVPFPTDAVHAGVYEAGYGLSANIGAVGLNWGWLAHDGNGQVPLATTGTLFGVAGTQTAAYGIDLSAAGTNPWTFSTAAFRSPSFLLNGSGVITTGGWQGTKIGLTYGGTNADLSATGGGASHVLKQASAGAAITVGGVATTDMTDLASGMATFLTTPTSANLAATVTNETGSGALVFGTAPTITLGNGTGLPISTGVSGLGTGIATWLATPSSANLASALTDETGSGSVVFSASPTFTGTLNGAAGTFSGALMAGGNITLPGASSLVWQARGGWQAPGDGQQQISNAAGSSFAIIAADAANILAQRNSTTGQKERVYQTFTDASNGAWAETDLTSAGILKFGSAGNGTGASTLSKLQFNVNATNKLDYAVTTAGVWTSAAQIITPGTATNDSAAAGNIGEVISNSQTGVSLTTATALNLATISLTAGDWDVCGVVTFIPAASTTMTYVQASISTTSATQAAAPAPNYGLPGLASVSGGLPYSSPVGCMRQSLSGTTSVYLVATGTFGTSTMTATGLIYGRRSR